MKMVTIVDYGCGNLLSVQRAVEYCGAKVIFAQNREDILRADYLILPGVGAFGDGMRGLQERGLVEAIQCFCKENKPFLGICLGMQMMLEYSDEFGVFQGLGLIKGAVRKIPETGSDGKRHRIPFIGWNELWPHNDEIWESSILKDIEPGSAMYFVHSFTAFPVEEKNRLADASYDGRQISAVIRKGNMYGCQFHPEKSGKIGLALIRNFISIR
nr:imidazole glycerol phosphate synthase subunit HisH [uncultured Anaeromusa sp.]